MADTPQSASGDSKSIEAVFFDLDGTLMDTASDFITVVNQMLGEDNQPLMHPDDIRSHVSAGSRKLVQLAYGIDPGHPDVEPHRDRLLDYYDRHINQADRAQPARLYPGILELLEVLEEKQVAWGIVTNKPEAYARPLVDQTGLLQRSQALICPDHVKTPKPDPQALFLACKKLALFLIAVSISVTTSVTLKQAGMPAWLPLLHSMATLLPMTILKTGRLTTTFTAPARSSRGWIG